MTKVYAEIEHPGATWQWFRKAKGGVQWNYHEAHRAQTTAVVLVWFGSISIAKNEWDHTGSSIRLLYILVSKVDISLRERER